MAVKDEWENKLPGQPGGAFSSFPAGESGSLYDPG